MAEMRAELVGLLIEKHGERAKIKLDKDKSKGEKIPKYLEAWCPINAKVGDVVGVEYQEMNKRKMQMILYGFPVLSVIAGAVFGNSIAVFFDIDKTMPVNIMTDFSFLKKTFDIFIGITFSFSQIHFKTASNSHAMAYDFHLAIT
jgi:positive regulator of sigma E activity